MRYIDASLSDFYCQRNVHKKLGIDWIDYREIWKDYQPDTTFQRFWDEQAYALFMYNAIDSLFVSYDDIVSVAIKPIM